MSRKIRITEEEIEEMTDHFEKNSIPYTYRYNNHSSYLECPTGSYIVTDSKIPAQELWFIAWVKQWIAKNKKHKLPDTCTDRNSIKYFYIKKNTHKKYNDIWEVDLDRAYWEMAFDENIIDDKIYYRGLWINKLTRLAALGQTAKKTENWRYNGKTMMMRPPTISKKTMHLWFNVCNKVGKIMYRAFKLGGNHSLFFWVDGIYVTNKKTAIEIMKFFHSIGYDSKIKKINEFVIDPSEVIIRKHNHKVRRFPVTTDKDAIRKAYYELQCH